jgi:hypothetical protein
MAVKTTIIKTITLSTLLLVNLATFTNAQESSKSSLINNESVIELMKSGLSETIIIAKIKSSKTNFDTSADSLVKLKEDGVTDNLILAMIESKSKQDEKLDNIEDSPEKTILGDLKDSVGKRIVYIESVDDESRIEIANKLSKKGFSVVNSKAESELLIELTYVEGETQQKSGIFKSGADTKYISKIGKLSVKLKKDNEMSLVYSHEYPYARAANIGAIFGTSFAPPSLRDQVKKYLVDDFLGKLKKAGDRFK